MNRKMLIGAAIVIVLLVAGARVFRSQEMPEPPDPPDPPDHSAVFLLNGGNPRLGVTLEEVTPEKAQELKLPAVAGALIESVEKDSAAAKAGLEKGDVIVEFDGVRVRSSAELRRLVRETPAGRTVAIKVVRGGKTQALSAKVEAPAPQRFDFTVPEIHMPDIHIPDIQIFGGPGRASLGISGDDLTTQLAQYFGVKGGKGVLVREVMVGSAAEKAGLKAGDVIVQVDSKPVCTVDELRAALNENFTDDTRKVNLTIVRDHHEQPLSVELTRSAGHGRHMASAEVIGIDPAQVEELHRNSEQMRVQAEQLRDELLKQKQLMNSEWQRQMQEQMRKLKEQLKNLPTLRIEQASSEI